VVAVAVDEEGPRNEPHRAGGPVPSPWHGLPVFSAWVAEAQDAAQPDVTAGEPPESEPRTGTRP
jgi:hypothetical protein